MRRLLGSPERVTHNYDLEMVARRKTALSKIRSGFKARFSPSKMRNLGRPGVAIGSIIWVKQMGGHTADMTERPWSSILDIISMPTIVGWIL
jgi:hypothetical protein